MVTIYPASEVDYLEMIESDHQSAIIKIQRTNNYGPQTFYFDARLCQKPEVREIIKDCWTNGTQNSVQEKIT